VVSSAVQLLRKYVELQHNKTSTLDSTATSQVKNYMILRNMMFFSEIFHFHPGNDPAITTKIFNFQPAIDPAKTITTNSFYHIYLVKQKMKMLMIDD